MVLASINHKVENVVKGSHADNWLSLQVLIPHRTDVRIESMSASQDYLVVFQRIKGLQVS